MAKVEGEHSGITIETTNDSGFINTAPLAVEALVSKVPVLGDATNMFVKVSEVTADGALSSGDLGTITASAAGFVSSCTGVADIAADPLGWLIGQGLDFLISIVQPLQDAIHWVSGDGPALSQAAQNFASIGTGIQSFADKFAQESVESLAKWDGDAAEAAAAKLGEFGSGIKGIAGQAGEIAQLLEISSMVMVVIEEFIKALLTEFITWLIMIWIPALAAAIPSAGASTAAAGTATGVKAASTGAKATKQVSKLQKLLTMLQELLAKLKNWFSNLKSNFKEIMADKRMNSVRATLGVEDGRGGLGTKLASKDGMVGKRLLSGDGFGETMKETAVDAAKSTVGMNDVAYDKKAKELRVTPGKENETAWSVAGQVGTYAEGAQKVSDHGSIGSDQDADETRDQLDF